MLSYRYYFVNFSLEYSKRFKSLCPMTFRQSAVLMLALNSLILGSFGCTLRYRKGALPGSGDPITISRPPQAFEAQSQSRTVKEYPLDGASYAKPITPAVVEDFPHLEGYEGNILLGNGLVQVVIAGIASNPAARHELDLILGVFERRGRIFFRLRTIERIVATAGVMGGRPLKNGQGANAGTIMPAIMPVGMDSGKEGEVAFVALVLADGAGKSERQWRFRLQPQSRVVSAVWEPYNPSSKDPKVGKPKVPGKALAWAIRVYGGHSGRIVLGPPQTGAPFVALNATKTPIQKILNWARVSGEEAFGISANRPFQFVGHNMTDDLGSLDQMPGEDAIDFVIGAAATSSLLVRQQAWAQCSKEAATTSGAAALSQALGCVSRFAIVGADLRVFSEQSADQWFPRGALIFPKPADEVAPTVAGTSLPGSSPVGFALLGDEHSPVISQMPGGSSWQIASVMKPGDAQTRINLRSGQTGVLEILPIVSQKVFIELKLIDGSSPGWDFPAVLSIFNTSTAPWTLPIVRDTNGLHLGAGRILVSRWPLQLEMAPGRYSFELVRGDWSCSGGFDLSAASAFRTECTLVRTAAPVTSLFSESTVWRADLGIVADERSVYALSVASDASLLSSEAKESGGKMIAKLTPLFTLPHHSSGLRLGVLPFDGEMYALWKHFRRESERAMALDLARFVREQRSRSEAISLLSCPGPSTVVEEYEASLASLRPDGVFLIGCFENAEVEGMFTDAVVRYALHSGVAPAILPVGLTSYRGFSGRNPKLAVLRDNKGAGGSGAENGVELKSILEAIKHKKYVIEAGVALRFAVVTPAKNKSRHLRVSWSALGGVKPVNFVVNTDGQDLIYPASPQAKAPGTKPSSGAGFALTGKGTAAEPFDVDLPLPARARWVHVAVIGTKTDAEVSGFEYEEILAMTPLIDLDEFTGTTASKAP